MTCEEHKKRAAYQREWNFRNREKVRETAKKRYYEKYRKFRLEVYNKEYYAKNKEEFNRRSREWRRKIKLEILTHYGGSPPRCNCCGETNVGFLTIDHLIPLTEEERDLRYRRLPGTNGQYLYNKLKRAGFPKGYAVACYNCNCARGHLGVCPHKSINTSPGKV